jgi:hypothetical protein
MQAELILAKLHGEIVPIAMEALILMLSQRKQQAQPVLNAPKQN